MARKSPKVASKSLNELEATQEVETVTVVTVDTTDPSMPMGEHGNVLVDGDDEQRTMMPAGWDEVEAGPEGTSLEQPKDWESMFAWVVTNSYYDARSQGHSVEESIFHARNELSVAEQAHWDESAQFLLSTESVQDAVNRGEFSFLGAEECYVPRPRAAVESESHVESDDELTVVEPIGMQDAHSHVIDWDKYFTEQVVGFYNANRTAGKSHAESVEAARAEYDSTYSVESDESIEAATNFDVERLFEALATWNVHEVPALGDSKPAVETKQKKVTKKEQVRLMLVERPRTIKELAFEMACSDIAAQSLIGDLKRMKVAIKSTKVDKATYYSVGK